MPEIGLTVGLPVATEFFPPHEYHRIVDVARMADDAGVTTVTVVDHVVMSDTNMKIYDQWGGFPFPVEAPWLEPLTQLAAIASATGTARIPTQGSWRPLVINSMSRPWRSMVRRGVVMELVGLTEKRTTIGWPVLIPPRMPPAWFDR